MSTDFSVPVYWHVCCCCCWCCWCCCCCSCCCCWWWRCSRSCCCCCCCCCCCWWRCSHDFQPIFSRSLWTGRSTISLEVVVKHLSESPTTGDVWISPKKHFVRKTTSSQWYTSLLKMQILMHTSFKKMKNWVEIALKMYFSAYWDLAFIAAKLSGSYK